MRILIVEDQEKLAQLLKAGLEREGYTADFVTDGALGERRIEMHHNDYDIIILDLMLPKRSGFEICEHIRKLGIKTPVLALTARDSSEDKVKMLDTCGADDYLVKPFDFKELLARLRALYRRPTSVLPVKLTVSDLELDPAQRTLTRSGKAIKLTLTEFRLLEYFMRHPNQIIERETLCSKVWDFNFESFSNIIDVYINRLRKKIDSNRGQKLIETIRGIGYKLNIA